LLNEALDLDTRELALIGVLMLRGPQTVGELNTRTQRWAEFSGLADVEQLLDTLVARDSGSLVTRLPRRPGQKEQRFAQLLGGEVSDSAPAAANDTSSALVPSAPDARDAQIASLELRVQQLEEQLTTLRTEFTTFRAQF
jgi:uncharacterized protein YceH (UPF0502 family)